MHKDITPQQAYELMQQGSIYVDVRSTVEFARGHAHGACNVPLMESQAATGQMMLNVDFLSVMQAAFSTQTPLLIGCQSGRRSVSACEFLAEAGYTNLYNVLGGFGGVRDITGQLYQTGWVDSGLPVSQDGESYNAICKRASQAGH